MHNLTQPGKNYQINTPFLAVKPKLGMTCSIPMPFARSARFEIESPEGCIVYLMVDWHEYPGQQLTEKMRFRARWRREAPVKDFADDYIIADVDGPGRLIGFVYAVDMLESGVDVLLGGGLRQWLPQAVNQRESAAHMAAVQMTSGRPGRSTR